MNSTTDTAQPTNSHDHPTLILIRGVPGSGKTYFAAALQQAMGKDRVVLLDPDSTDYTSREYLDLSKSLTEQGVDAKFHPYRYVRGKAHAAIEAHKILVWNQPFTNLDGFNKTVINLQNHATEHGTHLPLLVVEVEIDPATAKQRVTERKAQGGHGPSDTTFERFMNDYRSFSGEGYNTVVIHGKDDTAKSVATVQKALAQLWAA